MPIIKSAIKRVRQEKKRNAYNVAVKSDVKAKFKAVRDEISTGKVKDSKDLVAAIKEIDRAVKKGVINKHTAARKKSRLTKAYNAAATKPYGTEFAGQRIENPGKPGTKKTTAKKPAPKKAPAEKPTTNKPASKKTTK